MSRCRLEELVAKAGVRFGTSGVRGLVDEMTDEVCYAYVAAFLQEAAADSRQVVLGHDLRPSSPRIAAACAAAIEDAGRELVYIGAMPTPAVAYFAAKKRAPAVVVTGSHIPFDRNGIKFYRASGEISKSDESRIVQASIDIPDVIKPVRLPAASELAREAYLNRYLDFFRPGSLSGMRIAVYEHSSVARDVLRRILEGLGAQVISLGRTDTFVPIDTEAVRAEDIVQAREWAGQHRFDALVTTDGDADRPLIADENGEWLRGDIVGLLCAQFLQAQVVVTPVSSNTAVEKCNSFFQVRRTRIGSPYVLAEIEAALAQNFHPVVGYEANGGFLLGSELMRENSVLTALPTRDAVLPILALLCLARERQCALSQLSSGLPSRYTASDRLQNIASESSRAMIADIRHDPGTFAKLIGLQSVDPISIDETDGLRMTFGSGEIVHFRPSGNAPELRCYAEADTAQRAQALADAGLAYMRASMER